MTHEEAAAVLAASEIRSYRQLPQLVYQIRTKFCLGTRYSEALGASFLDEDGVSRPIVMGSYGIGIGRLLACVAEHHRDERGLALPAAVAPFDVTLVALGRGEAVRLAVDELYAALGRAGVEVLYDDRDASAGIKFADADLRGMPLRLTVSERSLKSGGAELRRRADGATTIVPLDSAVETMRKLVLPDSTTNDATMLSQNGATLGERN